uniref:Ig-like domain-containing protein n=1 Tax=Sphaeramia orbicularis TaxID=375764 RepID=A0A672ZB65_9TELE
MLNTHVSDTSVVGPSSHIVVMVGEDVVLPCSLEPAVDAVPLIVEWGRPDLSPRFVHVWHEGQDLLTNQNPSYRGRTSLSTDRMKHGDASLRLSKVTVSDNGTYRCLFPTDSLETTVQLVVGDWDTGNFILNSLIEAGGSVVLECECSGWYPEPEVSWMDSEGHLVSAGPPDTVRGPDDLYTVSSRVTVDKRHGSTVTCRVHQDRTNQTREKQNAYINACPTEHIQLPSIQYRKKKKTKKQKKKKQCIQANKQAKPKKVKIKQTNRKLNHQINSNLM